MNRKKVFMGVIGLAVAFLVSVLAANNVSPGLSQQSAEDLYQAALLKKEAEGDLNGAIKLFQGIIVKFPDRRDIAAKAQLQIGVCHEKLGTKEAEKAFQKVIDNYPEQSEAVKEAKEKLSLLLKAQALVKTGDSEFKLRQVWTGPLVDTCGAVSLDGRYLSFVDWETGDLAIRELATGTNRRLTDKGSWIQSQEFALFSKWSRDGKYILYQWVNEKLFYDLRIVSIDIPKPRILYSNFDDYVHPFDWSPDGKNVLVGISSKETPWRIGLLSIEDGSFRILKSGDKDFTAGSPPVFTFSPDGKYIAFSFPQDEDTRNRDIYLMSVDNKEETSLIIHPMNDSLLGWTPDGKWILFASDRTGSTDAWIVRVDKGKAVHAPEIVKKDLGQVEPLGFALDGSFYYGVSNQMKDIYSMDIDPGSGKILSPPKKATLRYEGSNQSPAYSEDGKYLAYISTRGYGPLRRNVLCIHDVQTGEERELNPEQITFNYPRWSPDGRFISVEGYAKDRRESIYKVDVQTGAVDPIVQAEPGIVIYSHRWSKDGKSIFYTRSAPDDKRVNRYRSSQIFIRDIASGQEKILSGSPSDAKDIDISPDGRWLVLLNRDDQRELRVIPTSGGDPRALYSFENRLNVIISPAWIAGGKYILFYQLRPDSMGADTTCELMRISAEGGEPQRLGLEMKDFRHFSVHPDGQNIVFHSTGSEIKWGAIWVMENFLPADKAKK
ncbi:MAG TPA: tetratricopeptide repeat protein [Candidatus Desulfaltia sp.]|nr:tetratricopeptide repeat protein [Candidatus Desulfaltia sp.]